MPIIKTYDLQDFKREFELCNRNDQFSDNALELIFNYLDQCYSDSSFEMDVISICCEFQEMTENEIRENWDCDSYEDIIDFIENETSYVGETKVGKYVFISF